MFSDWCIISLIETPALALSHLVNWVYVLLYLIPAHLIQLPLLIFVLDFGTSKNRARFQAKTILLISFHSFQKSVTMIANSAYTTKINFFRPVTTLLANLQSGRDRWKDEKTIFSRKRDLVWRVAKQSVALLYSHLLSKPVGIGWHVDGNEDDWHQYKH